MGDGAAKDYGLNICTDSYSLPGIIRLMNVLTIRYGLNCTAQLRRDNQYRIYISSRYMLRLQSIVGPYMHDSDSMMYKINK
jgi:hypothetical protein